MQQAISIVFTACKGGHSLFSASKTTKEDLLKRPDENPTVFIRRHVRSLLAKRVHKRLQPKAKGRIRLTSIFGETVPLVFGHSATATKLSSFVRVLKPFRLRQDGLIAVLVIAL